VRIAKKSSIVRGYVQKGRVRMKRINVDDIDELKDVGKERKDIED
jgi:hypothetical protein